ncbi:MAG: serine dehydratase beta chain, partial [Planctomycetota bacterium]
MKSIQHIYKIGTGPSSSHSIGPRRAAELFAEKLTDKNCKIAVELYGSLAATG